MALNYITTRRYISEGRLNDWNDVIERTCRVVYSAVYLSLEHKEIRVSATVSIKESLHDTLFGSGLICSAEGHQ